MRTTTMGLIAFSLLCLAMLGGDAATPLTTSQPMDYVISTFALQCRHLAIKYPATTIVLGGFLVILATELSDLLHVRPPSRHP